MALVAKESDGIAAYWLGAVALVGWFAMNHVLGFGHPGPASPDLENGIEEWLLFSGVFAFAIGHALGAGEHRTGTIEFLDGLPVARPVVFAAKLLAAAPVVVAIVAGVVATKVLMLGVSAPPHLLSYAQPLLLQTILVLAVLVGHLGLGLALSWLGGLGWAVLLGGHFGAMVFGLVVPSMRPYVFLGGLGDLTFEGTRATMPWGPVVVWWSVGLVGLAMSGALFVGPGSRVVAAGSAATATVRILLTGCLSLVLAGVACLSALGVSMELVERLTEPTRIVREGPFRFLYKEVDEEAALELIGQAPRLSEQAAALVGHDGPLPLDIELLGSARYHAGVFLGGKIRMGVDNGPETLVHELAHAHAYALSGWKAHHHANAIRFFEEGLASWVEAQVTGRQESHVEAAAMWRLGHARFDLLVDDAERNKRYDLVEAYALGEVWVESLVEVAGPEGPACVLRGLADVGAEPMKGISLWVRVLDGCGLRPDEVNAAYEARLSRAAEGLPETLPTLSVSRGIDGSATLSVADQEQLGWGLVCRFRDSEDAPVHDYEHRNVRDGQCPVPLGRLSGKSYQVQVGFVLPGRTDAVFGEWQELENRP